MYLSKSLRHCQNFLSIIRKVKKKVWGEFLNFSGNKFEKGSNCREIIEQAFIAKGTIFFSLLFSSKDRIITGFENAAGKKNAVRKKKFQMFSLIGVPVRLGVRSKSRHRYVLILPLPFPPVSISPDFP